MAENTNIVMILLTTALTCLAFWIFKLQSRINKFLKGKDAKTLDDSILAINKDIQKFSEFKDGTEKYLAKVEKRLQTCLRGTSTIRFNAFQGDGSGGNQSFASAFLNEKGDGAVISSIYSRERIRVYAKPVQAGNSKFELSLEEKNAIDQAKNNLSMTQTNKK